MIILNVAGNDIVDLKSPEARGKSLDIRFMERTLTVREREATGRSAHPDRLLWAFWAAKETAYKTISKIHPDISSSPRRYGVLLADEAESDALIHAASGVVNTPEGPVPVYVMFHADYVHCIGGYCLSGSLDSMNWGVGIIDEIPESGENKSVPERESYSARFLAASKIADIFRCHPRDVFISRQNHRLKTGPPKVYVRGKPADLDISLSHDGRFVAFAVNRFYN